MRISDWSSDVCSSDLFGPERQLDRIGEAEILVDPVGERAEVAYFLDDLVLAAENVRIVLRELAHAPQPVQRAVRTAAVAAAVLGQAQRQVGSALGALLYTQYVRRAVIGLPRPPN